MGGLRFKPMGSDEGGLEELVELSLSRASRSPTRCSNSAIRPLKGVQDAPGWRPGLPAGRCPRAVQGWEAEESCYSYYEITIQMVRPVNRYSQTRVIPCCLHESARHPASLDPIGPAEQDPITSHCECRSARERRHASVRQGLGRLLWLGGRP